MPDEIELKEQLDSNRRKVDVDQFDVTLREIVRMAHGQELKRAPVYQRKFRWSESAQSRLIESLLLGLPVPNIFVAANADGTWDLVDGLQRVSTIIHFVGQPASLLKEIGKSEPLELRDLQTLTSFNGLTFEELPTPMQLIFYKRSIRVTALSDKSDPDVRFDMFDRLNSGALALTAQEIRECIYSGRYVKFLRKMAQNDKFRALVKLPRKKLNDGTREELVLRFFAYLYDRAQFKGSVKEFLNAYAQKSQQAFDYEEGRELFEQVCDLLTDYVGGYVLRDGGSVTPLNQFEAMMVATAELLKEGDPIEKPEGDWLNDEELLRCSGAGTNSRVMLNGRINRAKELLKAEE